MKFDFKKLFNFKKPQNVLEGTDEAAPQQAAKEPPAEAAIPDKLAEKCEQCGQIVLSDEMKENLGVCPKCGHYKKLDARTRIQSCAEHFSELFGDVAGGNPLGFPGYDENLRSCAKRRANRTPSSAALRK